MPWLPNDCEQVEAAPGTLAEDRSRLEDQIALVQKEIPEAHLVACGPGVSRDTDEMRKLADQCPQPKQVHLVGPRLDMQNVYPAFSIAALSSCEGEAFPLVLGEAMACEIPCVATNVGDSALIVGDTGRIVEPRKHEAFASAIINLLEQDLALLGKQARQRVINEFSLDRYVDSHATLYRSIIDAKLKQRAGESKQTAHKHKKPHPVTH